MDVLCPRDHLGIDEAGELGTDLAEHRIGEAPITEAALLRRLGDREIGVAAAVLGHECADGVRVNRRGHVLTVEAELGEPHGLARSEVDAPDEDARRLGEVGAGDRRLVLAAHALGPRRELPTGFELRLQVRDPVGRELCFVELPAADAPPLRDAGADPLPGALVEPFDRGYDAFHGAPLPLMAARFTATSRGRYHRAVSPRAPRRSHPRHRPHTLGVRFSRARRRSSAVARGGRAGGCA